MKRKNVLGLFAAVLALVLLVSVPVFAEEPAQESTSQSEELGGETETAVPEAPEAGKAEQEQKSNPLLNGILIVVVIGAVVLCVQEIRRDNRRK